MELIAEEILRLTVTPPGRSGEFTAVGDRAGAGVRAVLRARIQDLLVDDDGERDGPPPRGRTVGP